MIIWPDFLNTQKMHKNSTFEVSIPIEDSNKFHKKSYSMTITAYRFYQMFLDMF